MSGNSFLLIGQRLISLVLIVSLVFSPTFSYAQNAFVSTLPEPGKMVGVSEAFTPILVKGLVVHPDQPLNFDFIVDSGNDSADQPVVKDQSERIVRYFLAALTVPEDQLWVNLSPYEKDRIIADDLGQTVLGRDMLEQDYVLKQLTASLIYPEDKLGKEFWDRIYKEAREKFGTTDIPVDTFNKVWIVPEKAEVFEKGNAVYVTQAKLKVMLDSDYEAAKAAEPRGAEAVPPKAEREVPAGDGASALAKRGDTQDLSKQLIREIILPAIEHEVNTGKNFATLRQIYYAAILAKWYRELVQDTLMSQAYVGKNKISGVNADDKTLKEQIYQRYIAAYKKGVFNYIKEEADSATGDIIPHKYFSGGLDKFGDIKLSRTIDSAMLSSVGRLFRSLFHLISEASTRKERTRVTTLPITKTGKGIPFRIERVGLRDGYKYSPASTGFQDWPEQYTDPKGKVVNPEQAYEFRLVMGSAFDGDDYKDTRRYLKEIFKRGDNTICMEIMNALDEHVAYIDPEARLEIGFIGLESANSVIIRWAIKWLSVLGDKRAVDPIRKKLTWDNLEGSDHYLEVRDVREDAREALKTLGVDQAMQQTPDWRERARALEALRQAGDEEALSKFRQYEGYGVWGRDKVLKRLKERQPAKAGGKLIQRQLINKKELVGKIGDRFLAQLIQKDVFVDLDDEYLLRPDLTSEQEGVVSSVADLFHIWPLLFASTFEEEARQYWLEGHDFQVVFSPAWGDFYHTGQSGDEVLKLRQGDPLPSDEFDAAMLQSTSSALAAKTPDAAMIYGPLPGMIFGMRPEYDIRQRKRPLEAPFEVKESYPVSGSGYHNYRLELGVSERVAYVAMVDQTATKKEGKYKFFVHFGNGETAMATKGNMVLRLATDEYFKKELYLLGREEGANKVAQLVVDWLKRRFMTGLYRRDLAPEDANPAMLQAASSALVANVPDLAMMSNSGDNLFIIIGVGEALFAIFLAGMGVEHLVSKYNEINQKRKLQEGIKKAEELVISGDDNGLRWLHEQLAMYADYEIHEQVFSGQDMSYWGSGGPSAGGSDGSEYRDKVVINEKMHEKYLLISEAISRLENQSKADKAQDLGGIDIKDIGVEKKSAGGKIQFNDAAMKAILDGGFDGFTPVFIRMTPISSPLQILGVAEAEAVSSPA